ncbi:MAG TPA: Wadjet anti-phage system protein JetA family protein [Chthoniobacterales bacterium]
MALSAELQTQLREGFFRPLGRPSWPVYVDAGDRLLGSSSEGGQLTREDALALLRDVLMEHPSAQLDADEGAGFSDARRRATQLYNRRLEAGWLQERPGSLGEYWVLVTPALRLLVRLLRDLARSDLGELKDFAASLRSICEALPARRLRI